MAQWSHTTVPPDFYYLTNDTESCSVPLQFIYNVLNLAMHAMAYWVGTCSLSVDFSLFKVYVFTFDFVVG